jgi:hypothetical protein
VLGDNPGSAMKVPLGEGTPEKSRHLNTLGARA